MKFVLSFFILALSCLTSDVRANEEEPNAEKMLRAMSDYMASLKYLSMTAELDSDIVMYNGQKIQLSRKISLGKKGNDGFYLDRRGMLSDSKVVFDGNKITLFVEEINSYMQMPVNGNIDNAISAIELKTGLPLPAADFLFADVYATLMPAVETSIFVGMAYIGDVECYQFAFREKEIDWQIWISATERPLPMKYIITNKWKTAAPEFEMRMYNWRTEKIKDAAFVFKPPKGAKKLESMSMDALGELIRQEGEQ